jgi:hypothetical protein
VVDALAVLGMSFAVEVWLIEAGLILISGGMLYWILRTAKKMDRERVVLLDLP